MLIDDEPHSNTLDTEAAMETEDVKIDYIEDEAILLSPCSPELFTDIDNDIRTSTPLMDIKQNDSDDIDFQQEREILSQIENIVSSQEEDEAFRIIPECIADVAANSSHCEISSALTKVLVDVDLVEQYRGIKRKLKLYPNSAMYLEEEDDICAKLQVKLVVEKADLKEKLANLSKKILKKNPGRLDLIPTEGVDKVIFDSIVDKLKTIDLLNPYFDIN